MARTQKKSCLRTIVVVGLAGLCLLSLGGVWLVGVLPGQIEQDFGAPGQGIDSFKIIYYGMQLNSVRQKLIEPMSASERMVAFKVAADQSVASISLNLESVGLIRDAAAFRLYLVYSGMDKGIQAGEYQLSPSLNSVEIARALQDATPKEVTFRILPGWRMEEIAAALPTSGMRVTKEQFLAAAQAPNREIIPASLSTVKNFEGYFLPEVYRFSREITAQEMVAEFLKRFDEKVNSDLKVGFQRQGLSLNQAVILASIVQREAMVVEEQAMIASVFYNRLKIKMKLDSDPTVQYAVGYNSNQATWWTNPLSANHLKINSPYNTYLVAGFPPGAICNPGIEAMQAVAFPATSPYFYFRARCDGSRKHNFAITFEEHLKNGCP